jgi:hypothetical protein
MISDFTKILQLFYFPDKNTPGPDREDISRKEPTKTIMG